jgi:hypothetical protein
MKRILATAVLALAMIAPVLADTTMNNVLPITVTGGLAIPYKSDNEVFAVCIDFKNITEQTINVVKFHIAGFNAMDEYIGSFDVIDSGEFSPGVQINHRLSDSIWLRGYELVQPHADGCFRAPWGFPMGTQLRAMSLKVKYDDGSFWQWQKK